MASVRSIALQLVMLATGLMCSFASAASTEHPSLADRLQALASAYPGFVVRVDGREIELATGARIVIDDGRVKDHASKLADADIEDMLAQIYPLGSCDSGQPPPRNFDPGRIRATAFFTAMYGASADAVKAKLTPIGWFGSTIQVTRANGVDTALARVRDDLAKLTKPMHEMFAKPAGTFNWRMIAGTSRPSIHSFAAAIDIATASADYWRWAGGKPGSVPAYKNRVPREVVRAFERHGFIWGGHWYHYDTMHFEYRPELIAIAELAGCRKL